MSHTDEPPATDSVNALTRALRFLETGAWQPAHEIVQKESSELAAWLHGIVHTLEGDLDNAQYWYRKARRSFPGAAAVGSEIGAARQAIEGRDTAPEAP